MQDLHTHSLFDDGSCSLEEMVRAAVETGLSAIGLSGHSPLPFANEWAIQSDESLTAFCREARRLKDVYRGRIDVFCALEYDALSTVPKDGFDYLIGSVHHLVQKNECVPVDQSRETTEDWLRRFFDGSAAAAESAYYAQYDALAADPAIDVIGHFDLLTKFDEERKTFSLSPACATEAMERLVRAGKLFEVNTGAISRKMRKTPYPSAPLLRHLAAIGGGIVFSSDAHEAKNIAFGFPEARLFAAACGFRTRWEKTEAGFCERPL